MIGAIIIGMTVTGRDRIMGTINNQNDQPTYVYTSSVQTKPIQTKGNETKRNENVAR